MIKNFTELVDRVKSSKNRKISVAVAQDADVLQALQKAKKANLADAILVGDHKKISRIAHENKISIEKFEVVEAREEKKARPFSLSFIDSSK